MSFFSKIKSIFTGKKEELPIEKEVGAKVEPVKEIVIKPKTEAKKTRKPRTAKPKAESTAPKKRGRPKKNS